MGDGKLIIISIIVSGVNDRSPPEDYFVLYKSTQGRITLQCTHNTIRHRNGAILRRLAHWKSL